MGMAASQARYLGLTARKTNTEYEGQQINQQRTALANQSANLFNQLMALTVPTPPSTQDFTKVSYAFNDGNKTEAITSMQSLTGDPDYNYRVTHSHTESVYTGIQHVTTSPGVTNVGGTYWIKSGTFKTEPYQPSDLAAVAQIAKDNATSQFATDYNNGTANIFSYKSGGVTYYVCKSDLEASISTPAKSLSDFYAANLDKKVETTEKAYIGKDSTGRLTSIQTESSPTTTFNLTTTSTTDQNAYNDAMNKYNYDTISYQKKVEDINAKTKVIQEEDRTLELRLKQLDTEQQALSTEMDAVKKVIDKNVESTFKTFS